MSTHRINFLLNGEQTGAEVPSNLLLADFLRDVMGLKGTKRGCETGVCGACSVHVNGEVAKSCLCLAVQIDCHEVVTIEGLATAGLLHDLQASFMAFGGLQCGYCTPGFVMAAAGLLTRNPDPTEDQIRHGLAGNLCRCTGYQGIVDAVRNVTGKSDAV